MEPGAFHDFAPRTFSKGALPNLASLKSSHLSSTETEVDDHPGSDRQTAGRAALATAELPVLNGEADSRFPEVLRSAHVRSHP